MDGREPGIMIFKDGFHHFRLFLSRHKKRHVSRLVDNGERYGKAGDIGISTRDRDYASFSLLQCTMTGEKGRGVAVRAQSQEDEIENLRDLLFVEGRPLLRG